MCSRNDVPTGEGLDEMIAEAPGLRYTSSCAFTAPTRNTFTPRGINARTPVKALWRDQPVMLVGVVFSCAAFTPTYSSAPLSESPPSWVIKTCPRYGDGFPNVCALVCGIARYLGALHHDLGLPRKTKSARRIARDERGERLEDILRDFDGLTDPPRDKQDNDKEKE